MESTKIKKIEYLDFKNKKRVLCFIDEKKKTIEYFLHPTAAQTQWIKSINIEGFSKLPGGFSAKGAGLTPKGIAYLMPKKLSEKIGSFDLIVSIKDKTEVSKAGRVTINYNDLRNTTRHLSSVKSENYKVFKAAANADIHNLFPSYVADGITTSQYKTDQILKILKTKDILDKLSGRDVDALAEFFPPFIKRFSERISQKKKVFDIQKSKKAIQIVYLEDVAKKFEAKIQAKNQTEASWQEFFGEYFLLFNPNYVHVFEKRNLSLSGKFPDFLPIDLYGYLDIFEIKRPDTTVMEYDGSRKNYFWSKELSKAIAQVESYLDSAVRYGPLLVQEIKKAEKIDIKVIRPRGFIIAGSRKQIKDENMEEYFRLLNSSLKNISVIFYDDVLNNVRSFLEIGKNKK